MDPDTSHLAPIRTLEQAMRNPARQDRIVAVDGTDVQLRWDPELGVDLQVEAVRAPDQTRQTTYHAADERPASYPPDLPFLPGIKATVFVSPGGTATASWWNVADVEGAVVALRGQCAAGGWQDGTESGIDVLPALRIIRFQRADGMGRTLQVAPTGNGTMILLVQSRG